MIGRIALIVCVFASFVIIEGKPLNKENNEIKHNRKLAGPLSLNINLLKRGIHIDIVSNTMTRKGMVHQKPAKTQRKTRKSNYKLSSKIIKTLASENEVIKPAVMVRSKRSASSNVDGMERDEHIRPSRFANSEDYHGYSEDDFLGQLVGNRNAHDDYDSISDFLHQFQTESDHEQGLNYLHPANEDNIFDDDHQESHELYDEYDSYDDEDY